MSNVKDPELTPILPTHTLRDYRTYITLSCAIFAVLSNVAIIACWAKQLRFGISITDGRWRYIDDGNAIALLGFWAQFLQIITVVLGGWAIAQLWARQVAHSKASLVGLQSLGIFSSIGTLLLAYWHLWKKRYAHRSHLFIYVPLVFCATVLQYYATAIITLAVPAFHEVVETRIIPAQTLPFMSEPTASTPCSNLAEPGLTNCLGNWYSQVTTRNILILGTASPSSATFDGEQLPPDWQPVWGATGPNQDSIALLTRSNPSVVDGVFASHDFMDSIAFSAYVPAIIPTLTSQCAEVNQPTNITSIDIAGVSYAVSVGIPVLSEGFMTGQLTTNSATLIISYPTMIPSTNIHCAVNLSLSDGKRSSVFVSSVANQTGRFADYIGYDPDVLSPDGTLNEVNFWPLDQLATLWLVGMNWGTEPTSDALTRYISTLELNVGTRPFFTNRDVSITNTYEAYSIFLLAGNIDIGFPPWQDDPTDTFLQEYDILKTQLVTGARTVSHYIALVVVGVDILFVLWSTGVVVFGGSWLPDWSDPAILMCTALASERSADYDDSSKGSIHEDAWKLPIKYNLEDGFHVGPSTSESEQEQDTRTDPKD